MCTVVLLFCQICKRVLGILCILYLVCVTVAIGGCPLRLGASVCVSFSFSGPLLSGEGLIVRRLPWSVFDFSPRCGEVDDRRGGRSGDGGGVFGRRGGGSVQSCVVSN